MTSVSATAATHAVRAARPGLLRHGGALGLALAIGVLAAAHGGYFPTSWGWIALVFFWAAAMVLLVRRRIALSRIEIRLLVAASALVAWIGLSIVWSSARVESISELERALVYL